MRSGINQVFMFQKGFIFIIQKVNLSLTHLKPKLTVTFLSRLLSVQAELLFTEKIAFGFVICCLSCLSLPFPDFILGMNVAMNYLEQQQREIKSHFYVMTYNILCVLQKHWRHSKSSHTPKHVHNTSSLEDILVGVFVLKQIKLLAGRLHSCTAVTCVRRTVINCEYLVHA